MKIYRTKESTYYPGVLFGVAGGNAGKGTAIGTGVALLAGGSRHGGYHHHPHPHPHPHPHMHMHWGPHVFFHPSPFWHPFGFFITALAVTAIVVTVSNASTSKTYYDNGTYYQEKAQDGKSGYVAVPAPIGAKVPKLPDGNTQMTLNDTDYYYYAGAFYLEDTDGEHYVVVQAPVGAVVPYLPDGNKSKTVNDIKYYVYDNIYYQAKSDDGKIVYEVVQNPGGSPDDLSVRAKVQ